MEKEQIIKNALSILEANEGVLTKDSLAVALNIDPSTLHEAVIKSEELVVLKDNSIQSRQAYREKRSYVSKLWDNITNKIE